MYALKQVELDIIKSVQRVLPVEDANLKRNTMSCISEASAGRPTASDTSCMLQSRSQSDTHVWTWWMLLVVLLVSRR